jgi:hypothetical protein
LQWIGYNLINNMKKNNYFRWRLAILLVITAVKVNLLWGGNPVSVPLDHRIYAFLDRMESLGMVDKLVDGIKPLDRAYVAGILIKINHKRDRLSAIDQHHLDNFLLDFRYEIDRSTRYHLLPEARNWYTPFLSFKQFKSDLKRFFSQKQPEEENHVILWEDSSNSFYMDYILQISYDRHSGNNDRFLESGTYRFRGSITRDFGYRLDVQFLSITGNEAYAVNHPAIKTSWYKIQDNRVYFDRSSGELAYRAPFIDFRFAHQPVIWGVGKTGSTLISDNSEQFPYVNLNKRWKWGHFSFLHGKLMAENAIDTMDTQPIYPDKWISINRLEMALFKNFTVGLSDVIIYGNRSIEWAYMFPIHFFRPIEHNLGDRDNALLAIDMEYRPVDGIKLYGTFLIDELRKSKLGTDWYGNKHGFNGGVHIVDPFLISNLALRAEYVAMMPWVYTHKYKVNRYTNDGRSIGYWSGPNSQVIFAEVEKEWHHRIYTSLSFRNLKHGQNFPDKNIGGDIMYGHNAVFPGQTEPVARRKFLEGILAEENIWQAAVRYELLNDLFIDAVVLDRSLKETQTTQHTQEIRLGFCFDY